MRKITRNIVSAIVAATMALMMTSAAFADSVKTLVEDGVTDQYTVHEPYDYPVTPDMEAWDNLETMQARRDACAVDKELLEDMDTNALALTVINYPFMIDMYAFDSLEAGIETVTDRFYGLKALLAREDAKSCLEAILSDRLEALDGNIDIRCMYASDLIGYLSEKETGGKAESYSLTTVTIYTKNNKPCQAYKNLTWADHDTSVLLANIAQLEAKKNYKSAVVVSGPSPTYNCHSYAWYDKSATNPYWIDNPTPFMTDGYYMKVSNPGVAYKVYYRGANDHSGIVTSLSNNTTTVTSKWGYLGVFSHELMDCPYADNSVEYWRTAG